MTRRSERATFIGVVLLLVTFATLSWTAILTKSATADEPLHAVAAYMRTFHSDFRLNPEDPPLWGYWAMLPQDARSLTVDMTTSDWTELTSYMWNGWRWSQQTLYRTPANKPDPFLARSRAMMLIIGVALAGLTALFAGRLAGPVAAACAAVLFAFDPNFLAHAPLVKNDVTMSLVMLALAYAIWRAGERLTLGRTLAIALLTGAALTVKFSGLILVPVLAILLIVRALIDRPWIVFGSIVLSRIKKLGWSIAILCGSLAVAIVVVWACYGFRFLATPDPNLRLNLPLLVKASAWTQLIARTGTPPSDAQVEAYSPTLFSRAVVFADAHRLLPEAWLVGLHDTYTTTLYRPSYLLGRYSQTGWWYYFPLAMLFKTPLATLAAAALAVALAVAARRRGDVETIDRWALWCLLMPIALYGASALTSRLNLGLRHVLPVYPFIYVLIAVSLARLIRWRASVLLAILAVGLIVESALAFPNYIPFFNAAFRSHRLSLLGDSNLDWGQDLKLLARWQEEHPQEKLYLSYFGMADPGYYLTYTPLPGNSGSLLEPQPPHERGIIAISATNLQGIYLDDRTRDWYRQLLRRKRPIDVLGGSIYLFAFDGRESTAGEAR